MKCKAWCLVLFVFLAAPATAQESVVAQVKADLVARGVSLAGPCGAFQITNEVARRAGLKLLKKVPGQNRAIPQPDGSCKNPEEAPGEHGYADGYLIQLPSGTGFDMLGDAGGANNPAWQPETDPGLVARNLASYADPVTLGSAPVPIPGPIPPTSDFELELLQRLSALQEHVRQIETKLDAMDGKWEGRWKAAGKFAAKYAPILLGAIYAGRATAK